VAELVGLKVDVLVAVSTPAALAAKNATQTIPIVMLAPDPVGLGLVGSLSRPAGNVTGLSRFSEATSGKRLELLKEVVPGLARVGELRNPLNPGDPIYWKETEVAAQGWEWRLRFSRCADPRTLRPHLRLPSNVTFRLSSPSKTSSQFLTGHGSLPWLPAA